MPIPLPPAKLVQEAVLQAVLPSFLAAAAVLGVALLAFGRRAAVVGSAVALIAGWVAGNYFRDITPWVPVESSFASTLKLSAGGGKRVEWLPSLAVAATVAGTLARRWPGAGGAVWAAVLAFTAVRLVPAEYHKEPWWAVPGFVLLNAAVGFGMMRLARRDPGATAPLLIAAALFAAGGVVLHAHSARLLDVTTVVGSALLGVAAVALFARADAGGALPGAAVFLSGTLLVGYHDTYSRVPWTSFLLPAVAPLPGLLTLVPPLSRFAGWRLRLIRAILVLVPLAAAVVLANRGEPLDFENL